MFMGRKKKKRKKTKSWIKPVKPPKAPKVPKSPKVPKPAVRKTGRILESVSALALVKAGMSNKKAGPIQNKAIGRKEKKRDQLSETSISREQEVRKAFVKNMGWNFLKSFGKAGTGRMLSLAVRKFLVVLLLVSAAVSMASVTPLYSRASVPDQLVETSSIQGLSQSTQAVIYDNADLLSEGQEQALLTHMLPISKYGDVAFISCSQVSTSTETYTETVFRQLYGSSSAVVFLIDMDNRNIWIFSDGQIHDTITNSYAETITDNVYTLAGDGDYYGCGAEAFDQMGRLLAGQSIARPAKYICNALLALILGLILNYIIMRILAARSAADSEEILNAIHFTAQITGPESKLVRKVKTKRKTSGGGGGSRGGGGGGGSGGGGGHGF